MDIYSEKLADTFGEAKEKVAVDVNAQLEAQIIASLMLQSNALVSIKMVSKLCSISRQEIDRRIQNGTFPKPFKISNEEKAIKKAFRIKDILEWLENPASYFTPTKKSSKVKNIIS